jgi:hypothetical protein
MSDKDLIPQKMESLLEREIEDEVIVMSPFGNALHTFEDTARSIWKLIDGEHATESILARIIEEYQVQNSVAQSDLDVFLEELEKLSLIKSTTTAKNSGLEGYGHE